MPKSCGCSSSSSGPGAQGPYVITYGGGQTKSFRSEIAANAFVAQTPGADITSAPAPAGG